MKSIKKRTIFSDFANKRKIKKIKKEIESLSKENDVKLKEIEKMLGNLKGKGRIETISQINRTLIKDVEKMIKENEKKKAKLRKKINDLER